MKRLDVSIQDGYSLRRGYRGRWFSPYVHRYNGLEENTERFHSHPWWLAVGIVLRGIMHEDVERKDGTHRRRTRFPLSVGIYWKSTRHRVVKAVGTTFFFGLFRSQVAIPTTAEFPVAEGYVHYTEMTDEEAARFPDAIEKRKITKTQDARETRADEIVDRIRAHPPEEIIFIGSARDGSEKPNRPPYLTRMDDGYWTILIRSDHNDLYDSSSYYVTKRSELDAVLNAAEEASAKVRWPGETRWSV